MKRKDKQSEDWGGFKVTKVIEEVCRIFESMGKREWIEFLGGERAITWAKYRWEFMRRDPEYIEAFHQALELEYDPNKNFEHLTELYNMFGFTSFMPNPDLSFEELLDPEVRDPSARDPYARVVMQDIFGFGTSDNPFEKIGWLFLNLDMEGALEIIGDGQEGARITMLVNFDKVNSIDSLKKRVSEVIDSNWKLYRDDSKKKTRKLVDYDVLLEVGDLKEKENMTYEEIAKRLFPRDFRIDNETANPEAAIRKVGQYYKRFQELSRGGYRDFTRI